jgi:hypothetical protein
MTRAVDKGALMRSHPQPVPVVTNPITVSASVIESRLGEQQSRAITGWLAGLAVRQKPGKRRS